MRTLHLVPSCRTDRQLVCAAALLREMGSEEYEPRPCGTPSFRRVAWTKDYLEELTTLFREDGSFNGWNPHAERVALCLKHRGKDEEAMKVFLAILGSGNGEVLFLYDSPKNHLFDSPEVADTPGKLGYEGTYQFAELAVEFNQKDLAKRLFLEIVGKIPTKCFPIRLQSIRVEALANLKKLGVERLPNGEVLIDALYAAKFHHRCAR
ncbi:MAG: hypothetical protein KGH56_01340 [Patescibacteria group bacterium]|nr:hypothetical protein [Patescibacteria group bacterium]